MISGQRHNQPMQRKSFAACRFALALALMLASISALAMQDSPALQATRPRHGGRAQAAAPQQHESLSAVDVEKYKPLIDELARLEKKIEENVQIPPPRTQSKLLPLLPASSSFYVAFPNYGETLHQINEIFLAQLKESPALNDWWQNKVGMIGPVVEDGIGKFYQFTQYLGDEIVVFGTIKPEKTSVLVMAQAKKPGLKAFLQQIITQYAGKSTPPVHIYTPQQLISAKVPRGKDHFFILVRPDYIVASSDLPTMQSFNAQLTRGGGRFTASPFGQRIAQTYPGGAQGIVGVDLQKILALRPQNNPMADMLLQQSGFADLKYLVVESKYAGGMASSTGELSFNGPRRGIASWLAAPAPLLGLDFISPDAAYAVSFMLKSPAQIFDEIKQSAENINPMASSGITQMETELKINLKQDLLSKLTGQFTVAVDGQMGTTVPWKVIAQITDPDGLQRTIKQLLAAANTSAQPGKSISLDQEAQGGVTYYTLHLANGPKANDVHYAFADGYLIVAGTHDLVKEAIATHRGGTSLTRSPQFQALAPQEHGGQASALLFENPGLFLATVMKDAAPDIANLFHADPAKLHGVLASAYGEESAIRFATNSKGFDPTSALVVAALVIPNIMKSKNAANEASAAATLRAVNTAQMQYISDYNKGYAPDLSTLSGCEGTPSSAAACLIDNKLACTDVWCTKAGFRFTLAGNCKLGQCDNYVVTATPVSSHDGGKNFCSTSDGVVRSQTGPPLTDSISVNDCQSWQPM